MTRMKMCLWIAGNTDTDTDTDTQQNLFAHLEIFELLPLGRESKIQQQAMQYGIFCLICTLRAFG